MIPAQGCTPLQTECFGGDFDDGRCFLCTPDGFGDLRNVHEFCDHGCNECLDYPNEILDHKAHDDGKRFLRPQVGIPPNRDAEGLLRDLVSMGPDNTNALRVPNVVNYERSPCHTNSGTECFYSGSELEDLGICSCSPPPSRIPNTDFCRDGSVINQRLIGLLPECGSFTGSEWPNTMNCRHVDQHGNLSVPLGGGELFNVATHRVTSGSCNVNMFIPCTARVAASPCPGSFISTPRPFLPQPTHYNENGHQNFDQCAVTGNTAQVRAQPGEPGAVRDAKNAVLRYLWDRTAIPNFRQLDHDSTDATSWTRYLDLFHLPKTNLPIAYEYPESRLLNSRLGVAAELRVRRASIRMSLYANSVSHRAGRFEEAKRMYPQARVRIRAECVVTARDRSEGGYMAHRPWLGPAGDYTPTITNEGTGHFPTVLPGFEKIAYTDSLFRVSDPPVMVEWWGMLGSFSNPPTSNRWLPSWEFAGVPGMNVSCGNLKAALNGVLTGAGPFRVPAWPYMGHSYSRPGDDPNQIYEGEITLVF